MPYQLEMFANYCLFAACLSDSEAPQARGDTNFTGVLSKRQAILCCCHDLCLRQPAAQASLSVVRETDFRRQSCWCSGPGPRPERSSVLSAHSPSTRLRPTKQQLSCYWAQHCVRKTSVCKMKAKDELIVAGGPDGQDVCHHGFSSVTFLQLREGVKRP